MQKHRGSHGFVRVACFSASASPGGSGRADAATGRRSGAAERLAAEVRRHLQAAREARDALLAAPDPRSIENTLALYDEILLHLDAAGHKPALLERVHPDPSVRAVAEAATREVDKFATELSLNRDVFQALRRIDASAADAPTRYYLERTLRDYRRAGVDKDEATRKRIQELNEELTLVGQAFARNIQSDTRTVFVEPGDLEGLPGDYVEAHEPAEDGNVAITTDHPDYVPFMAYSKSAAARERLYKEFRNRGHPANLEVLDRLLVLRYELARLLGYDSWAAYITEDKMVGNDEAARDFIERIARIAERRGRADYAKLLEYRCRDSRCATEVADWEKEYYEEVVKREEYDFGSQSVRPYFPYERVKKGLLDLTSRMFGVEYRQVTDPSVWHADVETYDVYEGGARIGRFHLDMHPRPDKYKHAAQFTIVNGVAGRQLPEAALVCNFPGGDPDDPGLMEHDDVETFFHEFGHLLHVIFAGRQRWMGIAGISTEWDFVEAPSQMLEEWARNAGVLRTFARHHETGEPIPAELVERLRRASEFGKGTYVRQQMYYAMLSLSLYDRDPKELDTTALTRELQNEYSMYGYVDGTHFQLSFGHLDGYSAIYYTYMWSLVIAKDMFSSFDPSNLLDPDLAGRYRERVLAAGGSAPAADLVARFLGRPYGFAAYEAWLNAK
ncbi:MAG: M3 family metallopeptidase [Candidatus Krumholzibacteriia bacterium]